MIKFICSLVFFKLSNLFLRSVFSETVNFGLLNLMNMSFRKDKFKNRCPCQSAEYLALNILSNFHENTRDRVLLFFISTYFTLAFVLFNNSLYLKRRDLEVRRTEIEANSSVLT